MKKAKISKNTLLLLAMVIATMIMGIGYASIESITGEIEGKVIADAQSGVFITDAEYVSDIDANTTNCEINNFLGTMLNSTIDLSKTNPNSEIKYKVTVHNSSTETVPFVGVVYDNDFYDNPDITFEITQEGFQIGQTIEPNETKEIYITFKYKNATTGIIPNNTVLKSYLNFKMAEPNRMVAAQYSGSTSNYLTSSIPKEKIESIKFEQGKEPEYSDKIIARFDASEKQDESIIGYYTDADNNDLYELTFVSQEIIYANKNANNLFLNLINVTNIELYNFSTTGVTSMSSMLRYCSKLIELDVSNWDTSKVKNFTFTFQGCSKLTKLDVSKWNTSEANNFGSGVSQIGGTFQDCSSLEELDVSNWDVSKVTDMSNIFNNCSGLTELNISNWDTSQVTKLFGTFQGCSKLTKLDVSKWNTSNVTKCGQNGWGYGGTFQGCISLEELDVSNWDVSKVTDMNNMFFGCSKLAKLDVSKWNTTNATSMNSMFYNCSNIAELDLKSFNTSNVKTMAYMFYNCSNIAELDLKNFDTSRVTSMKLMFYKCNSLIKLDVSNFNTSQVKDMQGMFQNCKKLEELNVSSFDTSQVTNISNMFNECNELKEIDVSGFNTSNVTNMGGMFYRCNNLNKIDVSNFDTSNVTNFSGMFYECYQFTELNLSSFNTINATSMEVMFFNIRNLKTIYVSEYDETNKSGWTTAAVTASARMFFISGGLVGGNGTKYDSNHIDATYARIDTEETPGYFTNIKDKPADAEQ